MAGKDAAGQGAGTVNLARLRTRIGAWRRGTWSKRKISEPDLRAFGRKFATTGHALIVYIEFPWQDLVPNATVLPHYETDCDRYYPMLAGIADGSYPVVVATGLLEHLRDPVRFLGECHRILAPGGKLYLSASCTFSIHRGPDDYFHATPFGMREWLSAHPWSDVDVRGSCGPYKTVGILLQRILLQCETRIWIRPLTELLVRGLPLLDRFVLRQYCDRSFNDRHRIDSMMPSNVQVIATR